MAIDRSVAISHVFSPAAPVDRRDLFAGRIDQLATVLDAVGQRGQHAIVYGERGVGKTSLTTVMGEILGAFPSSDTVLVPRTNCDGTDDFASVWRKVLAEVQITKEIRGAGFAPEVHRAVSTAEGFLGADPVTPNRVRTALQVLGGVAMTVVFIDEFDRIASNGSASLFADTIKTLSDHLVPVTVVFVGVADSVDELIAEHRSIDRALVQVLMPRMSPEELGQILTGAVGELNMELSEVARNRITQLSQGLPHYTHLLGQLSARAVPEEERLIDKEHVELAVTRAIERTHESTTDSYHRAIHSTQDNIYSQVLLACALAKGDELGFFAAADVREPLSAIMRRRYEIPSYARHLSGLSGPERANVLQRRGKARSYRYRFMNPLLQPYVIMKGLASKMIDQALLDRFAGATRMRSPRP